MRRLAPYDVRDSHKIASLDFSGLALSWGVESR